MYRLAITDRQTNRQIDDGMMPILTHYIWPDQTRSTQSITSFMTHILTI